jgi:hypothetical protein
MLKRFTLITVAISLLNNIAPVFGPPMFNELSNPGSVIGGNELAVPLVPPLG